MGRTTRLLAMMIVNAMMKDKEFLEEIKKDNAEQFPETTALPK